MSDSALLRRRQGLTLMEVLVAAFLMSLLLLILVRLFALGTRIGHEELDRSGSETTIVSAMRILEGDLQNTTASGVTLSTDKSRLVVHPMKTITTNRRVIYDDKMIYWVYDATENSLWRGELITPPGVVMNGGPARLSLTDLAGLPSLPAGSGYHIRNRFQGIESFSVENESVVTPPNVGQLLKLVVAANVAFAKTRKTVGLERSIRLRNSGN